MSCLRGHEKADRKQRAGEAREMPTRHVRVAEKSLPADDEQTGGGAKGLWFLDSGDSRVD